MAIIERAEDGRVFALEEAEAVAPRATVGGGVIGAVVGVLTGPVGLIVGAATGAVVGSLVDASEVESSEDALRWLTGAVPPGHTATIALVDETTTAVVDKLASDLGGDVVRRLRDTVELEIATAEVRESAEGSRRAGESQT